MNSKRETSNIQKMRKKGQEIETPVANPETPGENPETARRILDVFEALDLFFINTDNGVEIRNLKGEILVEGKDSSNPPKFSESGLIRVEDVKGEEKGFIIYFWNGIVLERLGGPYETKEEDMENREIVCHNGKEEEKFEAKKYYYENKQCIDNDYGLYTVKINKDKFTLRIDNGNTKKDLSIKGTEIEHKKGINLFCIKNENEYIIYTWNGTNLEKIGGPYTNADISKDKIICKDLEGSERIYKYEDYLYQEKFKGKNLYRMENKEGSTKRRLEYDDGKSKNRKVAYLYVEKKGEKKALVIQGEDGKPKTLTEGTDIEIEQIGRNLFVIDNGDNKNLISIGEDSNINKLPKNCEEIERIIYRGHPLRLVKLKISDKKDDKNDNDNKKYEIIELLDNNTEFNSLGEYKEVNQREFGSDKKKGLLCQSDNKNKDDKIFYYGDFRRNTEVISNKGGFIILKRKVKFKIRSKIRSILHLKNEDGEIYYLVDTNRNILLESKNELKFIDEKSDDSILISEKIKDGKESNDNTYKLYKRNKGDEGVKKRIYYLCKFKENNLPDDYKIPEGRTPLKCKIKYGDPYHFDN